MEKNDFKYVLSSTASCPGVRLLLIRSVILILGDTMRVPDSNSNMLCCSYVVHTKHTSWQTDEDDNTLCTLVNKTNKTQCFIDGGLVETAK